MFNKKLILLTLFAIFCIGITVSSTYATENITNIDDTSYDLLSDFQEANDTLSIVEKNKTSENIEQTDDSILKVDENTQDNLKDTKDYAGKLNIWIYEPTSNSYLYSTTTNPLKCGVELYDNNGHQLGIFVSRPTINFTVLNQDGEVICAESQVGEITSNEIASSPQSTYISTSLKSTHYTKYIKVGKYKIPVWSDDSLNTQKNKVIKYLNKHVKKAHTLKKHGYKFKISAKMYRKVLYYKKYGYDGKMGYSNFKVKTNKYYNYKVSGNKKVKLRVYAWGVQSLHKVGVQFRGSGHGYKNIPISNYYLF